MPSIETSLPVDAPVSVVVPVCNGARWLPDVLTALGVALGDRRYEILVIDDGSIDGSAAICHSMGNPHLQVIEGPRRGAAAAVNVGLRLARHHLVAQIDQDVIVGSGWFDVLIDALRDPRVAAAQGWYHADPAAPALARVMGIDLEQRYARIDGGVTDHVCTGNVVWRLDALRRVGLLDESLGYGYDNDLSYRLTAAGYHLVICRQAASLHRWREGLGGYLRQQYGFGYGRLDLVSKHRGRAGGDAVSPLMMMAHPVVMCVALGLLAGAALAWLLSSPVMPWLIGATALLALLAVERTVAGVVAARGWRDSAALLFPVVHLLRDLAWVAAMGRWTARRLAGAPWAPAHSMQPRPGESSAVVVPIADKP